MPDSSGAFDLGSLSAEDRERLNEMADELAEEDRRGRPQRGEGEPNRHSVSTAFVVAVEWDGRVGIHEYDGPTFAPGDHPTNDQLVAVGAVLQKDVTVAESAERTIQLQMQMAAQMQAQSEAQRIAQATQGGVDLSNIRGRH